MCDGHKIIQYDFWTCTSRSSNQKSVFAGYNILIGYFSWIFFMTIRPEITIIRYLKVKRLDWEYLTPKSQKIGLGIPNDLKMCAIPLYHCNYVSNFTLTVWLELEFLLIWKWRVTLDDGVTDYVEFLQHSELFPCHLYCSLLALMLPPFEENS